MFQPSSLIQSSWPHLSPGSAEGPGTVLPSLCRGKASQSITAPHLFRDDAHFPLRPGVRFPKLWTPLYHVLISASPILPNKAILWRCGSLRKTNSSADGFMKSYKYTDPNTYCPMCRQTIIPQKSHVILVDLCFMARWIHSAHSFVEMESVWYLYLLVPSFFGLTRTF